MYPLGHIGITLFLGKWLSEKLGERLNTKLVILGSMLPDLIDKPLGLLGFGGGRFVSHSLIFILMLVVKKELFFGSLIHLVLDRMWEEPEVLFFPFLGFEFGERVTLLDFIQNFLKSRYSQFGELIGTFCLLSSIRKRKIGI